jgi:predicted nucleotidyltransferase
VPEAEQSRHLRPALEAILALLKDTRVPGVVIGGLAVGIHAKPRMTHDVDILTIFDVTGLESFLAVAARHGFECRRPDPATTARRDRMVLLRHAPSGVSVDIALGCMPFDVEAVGNAVRHEIAGVPAPITTADDLIVMKAVAHRPIDTADLDMILTVRPPDNLRRIRRWVKQYADLLHDPEMVANLERVLKRHKGAGRPKPKGA